MSRWSLRRTSREDDSTSQAGRDWRSANEFDAYLGATYIEYALRNYLVVPAWVWVNPLAHGTIEDLEQRARGGSSKRTDNAQSWFDKLAFLAEQVLLRAGGDPARLCEMQDRTLLPIELTLANQPKRITRPGDVAAIVLEALADEDVEPSGPQ